MEESKKTAPVIRMLGVNYLPDPIVDRSVNGIVYYGYAPVGTDENEEGWLIIRSSTANHVTRIEYAQPDPKNFVHVWTDRKNYFHSSLVRDGYLYNGEFYTTSSHTTALPHDTTSVYIDAVSNEGYIWNGTSFEKAVTEESGGSGTGSGGGNVDDVLVNGESVLVNKIAYINTHVGSTTLDSPLVMDKQYCLGNISSLNITLPISGAYNAVIQITFHPSESFTPTISGTYVGEQLTDVLTLYTYEYLFAWNGSSWVLSTLYY